MVFFRRLRSTLGFRPTIALGCLLGVFLLAGCIVSLESWLTSAPAATPPPLPGVGDPALDFLLKDPEGRPFHLGDWVGRTPLVIEFGSFT
jgi:hypothetical protein